MKAPLYITSNNTIVRKSDEYLIIDRNGRKIPVPSEGVSYIVKWGNSGISEQLLNFLSDKEVPIFRFSYGGKPSGTFLPPEHNIGKGRLKQYETYFNIKKRLVIAKEFVRSAAHNKIALLKKYSQKEHAERIKTLMREIDKTENVESLRGVEGSIASAYFAGLKHCFKKFEFSGREYNPPKDEINALMSFSYAMLYAEIFSKIFEHGLCPYLGYLHEQNNGQQSLVYDISEVFKQNMDAFILSLINTNQIHDFHFNRKEDGACLLNTQGKNTFLKEWIAMLRSTNKKGMQKTSFSEIIRKEVIKLKQYLEDDVAYEGSKI